MTETEEKGQKVISLSTFKREKAKAEQESGMTAKQQAAITFHTAIGMIKQSQDSGFFDLHGKDLDLNSVKFKLAMLLQQRPESVWVVEKVIDGLFPINGD